MAIQIEVNKVFERRKVLKSECRALLGNLGIVHDEYFGLMQSFNKFSVDSGAILDREADQVALRRDVFHDDFGDGVAALEVEGLQLDVVIEDLQQGNIAELHV